MKEEDNYGPDPRFQGRFVRASLEILSSAKSFTRRDRIHAYGDIATAKTILRDYINATVGFTELAEATHIPSKSLMRMLGPTGNPRAEIFLMSLVFAAARGRPFPPQSEPLPGQSRSHRIFLAKE